MNTFLKFTFSNVLKIIACDLKFSKIATQGLIKLVNFPSDP